MCIGMIDHVVSQWGCASALVLPSSGTFRSQRTRTVLPLRSSPERSPTDFFAISTVAERATREDERREPERGAYADTPSAAARRRAEVRAMVRGVFGELRDQLSCALMHEGHKHRRRSKRLFRSGQFGKFKHFRNNSNEKKEYHQPDGKPFDALLPPSTLLSSRNQAFHTRPVPVQLYNKQLLDQYS